MIASTHYDVISRTSLMLTTPYLKPTGELQILVAKLLAEVFNIDQVGADDDFFDLGGDSLLAEVLSMRICKQTKHDFRPSSLVEFSSPRRIAEMLERMSTNRVISTASHADSARPPIFVVHGRGGFTLPEPAFFRALARGQQLRMFELPGLRGGRCCGSIEEIAAVYVDQLVTEYPNGPILLAAFCAGGLIALEMAEQIANMGRSVCQLVLLDPPIRQGTLGVGRIVRTSRRAPQDSIVKAMLRPLLPLRLHCRYHDLKYRMILLRRRREGRLKYSEYGFSIAAQAKLFVAFLRYRPRPYGGRVTIISSDERSRAFRGGSHLENLLPKRRIELVAGGHGSMGGNANAARLMQEAFDGVFGNV